MNLHRNAVRGILLSACVAGSASAKIGMEEAFAAFSYLASGASACADKVGAAHAFHSIVSHVPSKEVLVSLIPSKEIVSYALWHGGKGLSQLGLDNKGKIALALATYYGKDRAQTAVSRLMDLHEEAQRYQAHKKFIEGQPDWNTQDWVKYANEYEDPNAQEKVLTSKWEKNSRNYIAETAGGYTNGLPNNWAEKTYQMPAIRDELKLSSEILQSKQKLFSRIKKLNIKSDAAVEAYDYSQSIQDVLLGNQEAIEKNKDLILAHQAFLNQEINSLQKEVNNYSNERRAKKLGDFFGTSESSFNRSNVQDTLPNTWSNDGKVTLKNNFQARSEQDILNSFSPAAQRLAYAEQKLAESRLVNNKFVRGLDNMEMPKMPNWVPFQGK